MAAPPFKGQNVPSPGIFGGNWYPEALQYFEPIPMVGSWAGTTFGIGTIQLVPFVIPTQCMVSAVDLFLSQSYSATNAGSSQNISLSISAGIYSNLAGSLQSVISGSVSNVASVTGSTSSVSFQGVKRLPVPLTGNLYEGNYWLAILSSTSSAGNAIAAAVSNVVQSFAGGYSNYSGVYGSSTFASQQAEFGIGSVTATSSVLPTQIAFSNIGGAIGNTGIPVFQLKNYTA
jgi:hypothetical protein